VRPGIVAKDADGNVKCVPIFSKIITLFAERNDLQYAVPGGLIGVGTKIDPTLCRGDRLVGQVCTPSPHPKNTFSLFRTKVLGEVGKLPDIFTELEINFFLLRRLLGVKAEGDGKQIRVWTCILQFNFWMLILFFFVSDQVTKLAKGETLMVNIGSTSTGGRVIAVRKDLAKIVLISPVCTMEGEKIALSRRVEKHWR